MHRLELRDAIQFILANLENTLRVVQHAYGIREHLSDLAISGAICERNSYKINSVLSLQSCSTILQNHFIEKHGTRKFKASKNRGDFEKPERYINTRDLASIRTM